MAVLFTAGFLTAGGAVAQETTAAPTTWRCWYNAPEHVSCLTPTLRQKFLHIPLHNIPFDMDGPRRLAQIIMCGARPNCSVDFTRELPTALELEQAMDPLLAAVTD